MRVAVVTHGFSHGGGVSSMATWLVSGLVSKGIAVEVLDLATSSRDSQSMRLLSPSSWLAGPRIVGMRRDSDDAGYSHWGCSLAEFEPSRYLPRRRLTEYLGSFDLIHVVAGAPCWANVVRKVRRPRVLQVATTVRWERESRFVTMSRPRQFAVRPSSEVVYRMERTGIRVADQVIVLNKQMRDWTQDSGQPNVSLLPPGVDIEKFKPLSSWHPSKPIIAVGRLGESRKGWDRLFQAYGHLLDRMPGAPSLILAGRGSLLARDREVLHRSAFRDKIEVRQDLPEPQLIELLQAGSMLVQTSHEEGLGLAGLEAMACGLPMVATDTAGTREYLHDGVNGLLVHDGPGVATQIANGMAEVLLGAGSRMSIAAREEVELSFSSEKRIEEAIALYARVLETAD